MELGVVAAAPPDDERDREGAEQQDPGGDGRPDHRRDRERGRGLRLRLDAQRKAVGLAEVPVDLRLRDDGGAGGDEHVVHPRPRGHPLGQEEDGEEALRKAAPRGGGGALGRGGGGGGGAGGRRAEGLRERLLSVTKAGGVGVRWEAAGATGPQARPMEGGARPNQKTDDRTCLGRPPGHR